MFRMFIASPKSFQSSSPRNLIIQYHSKIYFPPQQQKIQRLFRFNLASLRMTFVKDIKNTWVKVAEKMGVEVNPITGGVSC